ncbi:sorbose reductase sou1 [Trametes coccinea BRFM310]|uniref:Sorbose reductase sou1 n=1 Tax=Trametes coccinea (strain BRFM310) TaxID=1353009 RepID=A0A1Y2IN46_TRAC3|nr:sorbose reductase sou1 [Trametes coccinea BRFM310]
MIPRSLSIRALYAPTPALKLGRARWLSSSATRAAAADAKDRLPPYNPVGVARALQATPTTPAKPTIFEHEFSLADRVALVSGANRGIGLEMAMALAEAGVRAVYCLDLPKTPGEDFVKVKEYVARMEGRKGEGRLEYMSGDVTDQEAMWKLGEEIGKREGRMDVSVAAAGVLKPETPCLDYPAKQFKEASSGTKSVLAVNVNGVLFTAQAAGRQMVKFNNGGSIIMIASICGSLTIQDHPWVSYNTSKSAVLQMARSMACELGPQGIRVNTISPGYINTSMTGQFLQGRPDLLEKSSNENPMGRIGRPDELRGATVWLSSDASSFCTGSNIVISGGHHAW